MIREYTNASSCVVTLYKRISSGDTSQDLPFASVECNDFRQSPYYPSNITKGCWIVDSTEILNKLGLSEHQFAICADNTIGTDGGRLRVRLYFKEYEIVSDAYGDVIRKINAVNVNDIWYNKYDDRIFFNGTDEEWGFKEDFDMSEFVKVDDKYYRRDDADNIVFIPGRDKYILRENAFWCDRCEEWHLSSYEYEHSVSTSHGEETWCEGCCNNHAFWCSDCECYYDEDYIDYHRISGGNTVCQSCIDRNYNWCECCGSYVWYESYDSDAECCESCRDDNQRRVHSYHDSHGKELRYFVEGNPVNFSSSLKVFGFELEVDDGESPNDVIEMVDNTDASKLVMNFEHDGSLSSNGFETISYPMDMKTFKSINWDEFLKCYRVNGFRSDEASNSCSLHMHFNRQAFFGNTQRSQENNIAKLYVFFRKYWEDLKKASRRRYLGWCELDEDIIHCENNDDIIKERAKDISVDNYKKCNNHHTAINQGNRNTVEIRLGKGTLNTKSFIAWIDFMYHVINNMKRIPFAKSHDGALWLRGISNDTKVYLRKRGAFIQIIGESEMCDIETVNVAVAEDDYDEDCE